MGASFKVFGGRTDGLRSVVGPVGMAFALFGAGCLLVTGDRAWAQVQPAERQEQAPVRAMQRQAEPPRRPMRALRQTPQRAPIEAVSTVRRAPQGLSDAEQVNTLPDLDAGHQRAIRRGEPGTFPQPMVPRSATDLAFPQMHTSRIAQTPDIHQHARYDDLLPEVLTGLGWCTEAIAGDCYPTEPDPQNEGSTRAQRLMPGNYCGPASLANNLVYLAQTRFPQLTTRNQLEVAAYSMIDELGPGHANGIGFGRLIEAGEAYLEKRGVRPARVRVVAAIDRRSEVMNRTSPYANPVPASFAVRAPTLADLQEAIARGSMVITLWGFYSPVAAGGYAPVDGVAGSPTQLAAANDWRGYWDRSGGHWVAAVGYGIDRYDNPDPSVLIYHNSAGAGSKTTRFQEYVSYSTLANLPGNPMLARRVADSADADTSLCPELNGRLVFCRARANGLLIAGPPPAPDEDRVTLIDGVVIFDFD